MMCHIPPAPPSRVQGKSRIPSIFDLISHLSFITVRTYENQNAYQLNMDILDIRNLVMAGGGEKWREIDAVAVWEPTTSQFELEGLVRSLNSTRALGVIAISDDFIASYPDAAVQFLMGIAQAWIYFSPQIGERVMQWYIDD
jgi:hypothetical protein